MNWERLGTTDEEPNWSIMAEEFENRKVWNHEFDAKDCIKFKLRDALDTAREEQDIWRRQKDRDERKALEERHRLARKSAEEAFWVYRR
jgi:hypothetical protein